MPRLLTPVQYESTLDELNVVRPLELADEVKLTLDIPILNVNPVSQKRPAIGKLARCNQRGALLQDSEKGYKNTEAIFLLMGFNIVLGHITFSQKVYGCSFYVVDDALVTEIYWTDSTGVPKFQDLPFAGVHWLDFVGTDIYIGTEKAPFGTLSFYVIGYY